MSGPGTGVGRGPTNTSTARLIGTCALGPCNALPTLRCCNLSAPSWLDSLPTGVNEPNEPRRGFPADQAMRWLSVAGPRVAPNGSRRAVATGRGNARPSEQRQSEQYQQQDQPEPAETPPDDQRRALGHIGQSRSSAGCGSPKPIKAFRPSAAWLAGARRRTRPLCLGACPRALAAPCAPSGDSILARLAVLREIAVAAAESCTAASHPRSTIAPTASSAGRPVSPCARGSRPGQAECVRFRILGNPVCRRRRQESCRSRLRGRRSRC